MLRGGFPELTKTGHRCPRIFPILRGHLSGKGSAQPIAGRNLRDFERFCVPPPCAPRNCSTARTWLAMLGSALQPQVNGSRPSNVPASSRCWSLGFPTAPSLGQITETPFSGFWPVRLSHGYEFGGTSRFAAGWRLWETMVFQNSTACSIRHRHLAACVLAGSDQRGGFPPASRGTHHAGRCQVDPASVRNRAARTGSRRIPASSAGAILCRCENPYPLGNEATALPLASLSSFWFDRYHSIGRCSENNIRGAFLRKSVPTG